MLRTRLSYFSYVAAAALGLAGFAILLLGREYVFDDTGFLLLNPDIARLKTFWDCFSYPFQPTKPVTNFFLALSVYWGHAAVTAQRLCSLLFHLATATTVYFWLTRRWRHVPEGKKQAAWAALLFAVFPIQSETLGIAQFRGEIIATWALVTACLLAEEKVEARRWAGILLLQAVAFLSKEVLGVAFTLIVACGYFRSLRRAWPLLLGAAVWGAVLYVLFQHDKTGVYSYRTQIGSAALPGVEHFPLAVRALLEGTVKTLSGLGLSSVRLRDRMDVALHLPFWLKVLLALSLGALSLYLGLRRSEAAYWIRFSWIALAGYLIVPNVNIGSEHYWYCASIGMAVLVVIASQQWQRARWPALAAYALLLSVLFIGRAFDYQTRLAFHRADWERHPETASTWLNLASSLSQQGAALTDTMALVEQARKIDSHAPGIAPVEFMLLAHDKQIDRLPALLDQMTAQKQLGNRTVAQFHYRFSRLLLEAGRCQEALSAAQSSLRLDAGNPFVLEMIATLPCRG